MTDEDNNAAVRLQAAQTILNNAGKFMERLISCDSENKAGRKSPYDLDI